MEQYRCDRTTTVVMTTSRGFILRLLSILYLIVASLFHRCYLVNANNVTKQDADKTDLMSLLDMIHQDAIEDSLFDPITRDPSCHTNEIDGSDDCYSPPASTIETDAVLDATCFKGGDDLSEVRGDGVLEGAVDGDQQCSVEERFVDRHWGSDPKLLAMREQLRRRGIDQPLEDRRPPIFLLPGLASTRLVAWKLKKCAGVFGTDIKIQDNVWLNINLVIQMGTVNVECMTECLRLGVHQSDNNNSTVGCKLRPDEGLDAIASLAPGGIGSSLLVGGTNTVYSWLIQWLADNLSYDVTNIIGLPYDWRLSPDKMEARDGFLSMMRRRIEAAVASNGGQPGIMVAHSMGNLVFRYFLDWLRVEMREEAYAEFIARARRREKRRKKEEDKKIIQQKRELERQERQQQIFQEIEELNLQLHETEDETSSPPQQVLPEEAVEDTQTSIIPGWMMAAVPGLDNVLGWFSSEGEEGGTEAEMKGPQDHDGSSQKRNFQNEPNPDASDASNFNQKQDETRPGEEVPAALTGEEEGDRDAKLRELAIEEGDAKWNEWIDKHVWTYIGLSAPLLGAVNPLRAVLSGENMGLPISDEVARYMEVTFGSTHTINPVSVSTGFCDDWDDHDWEAVDGEEMPSSTHRERVHTDDRQLACLDDIMNDIEFTSANSYPWKNFPALKSLLRDRMDWGTGKPMVDVEVERCHYNSGHDAADSNSKKKKKECFEDNTIKFGPKDVENGHIFDAFSSLWPEEGAPLIMKREQLEESFINSKVANILNRTWERPNIKHVVMAYGVDVPTEVGYIYKKTIDDHESKEEKNETTGLPHLKAVLWEDANGKIMMEPIETPRVTLADHFMKKKTKRVPFTGTAYDKGHSKHSGDGSVPYLSLSWAHTWLLHAARARHFEEDNGDFPRSNRSNVLDHISISHRPHGATEWVEGPPPEEYQNLDPSKLVQDSDTGTDHPHGTRYKPLMTRYHNTGTSRNTGIEYTTTLIEALGVEHKETTRNYDILAAVFTDAVKFMHDDFGLVGNKTGT